MISKKATSTPLNPKSKCKTKEMKIECKSNTLCSWRKGKNQETLICFLECFWVFFLVFGREKKKCREQLGRKKILEKCVFSLSGACLGLFIASSEKIERGHCKAASSLSMAAGLNHPLIGLILTPLERYSVSVSVSKKVWNSKIQRLDQKLWLLEVCKCNFHNFLDISTVLTPISTHEQSLE